MNFTATTTTTAQRNVITDNYNVNNELTFDCMDKFVSDLFVIQTSNRVTEDFSNEFGLGDWSANPQERDGIIKKWRYITLDVTSLKKVIVKYNNNQIEVKIKKDSPLEQIIMLLYKEKIKSDNFKYKRSLIYTICELLKNEFKDLNVDFDYILTSVHVEYKNKKHISPICLEGIL